MTNQELGDRLLAYFQRTVLCRYRASPDLFQLQEDDMGGELAVTPQEEREDVGPLRPAYFRVRFGFRRLDDGRVVVAAFRPDLESLPESENGAWAADYIEAPSFRSKDSAFERWKARNLEGAWTSEDGPLRRLDREIDLISALTKHTLGESLFRAGRNPALNYPIAENTTALEFAHLELYRLVVEGLRSEVLRAIAEKAGASLSNPGKTLNSLKEILPEELHGTIHEPLRVCRDHRNRVHGIRSSAPRWRAAFDAFHADLDATVNGLSALRLFLEETIGARAAACLRREEAMKVGFPKFQGPARPEMKIEKLTKLVGRTIERVEWGELAAHPDRHQGEAIVLHFSDGSAACIDVGSNAGNLQRDFEGLKPDMISTSLGITVAPSPQDESV